MPPNERREKMTEAKLCRVRFQLHDYKTIFFLKKLKRLGQDPQQRNDTHENVGGGNSRNFFGLSTIYHFKKNYACDCH